MSRTVFSSLLLITLMVISTAVVGLAPAMAESVSADPSLKQKIDATQPVVQGSKTLEVGHVDIGPRFINGDWTTLIHDDSATGETGGRSVWRQPDQTVLRVKDEARMPVPDDPAYDFIGAEPGTEVYVVPQTQNPEVVWIGWNTQDPEVMDRIDRGITMSLEGVEGPGELVVYLQSGDFGRPEVLWDSRKTLDPIWVDVNTHTHANWVFTAPGTYLVRVRVAADLVDGTTVEDSQELRFSVGTGTDPDEAMEVSWTGAETRPEVQSAGEASVAEDREGDSGFKALPLVLVGIGVVLIFVLTLAASASRKAKRRARSEKP